MQPESGGRPLQQRMLIKTLTIAVALFAHVSLSVLCLGQARQPAGRSGSRAGVPPHVRDLLEKAGVRVGELTTKTRGSQEFHIHWEAEADPTAGPNLGPRQRPPKGGFGVTKRTQTEENVPLQRAPELSSSQMLVVAVDEHQALVGWTLIADPQIVRAETPDVTGKLSGQILYHSQTDFSVALPADPTFDQLRFYHPEWTGETFILELLGAVAAGG